MQIITLLQHKDIFVFYNKSRNWTCFFFKFLVICCFCLIYSFDFWKRCVYFLASNVLISDVHEQILFGFNRFVMFEFHSKKIEYILKN
jgi:hypothetical protein